MDILQVQNGKIVDAQANPVRLRGVCVGGWMNMEHFINGYPGDEHGLRATVAGVLGSQTAQFFFDRMLDYFWDEQDVAFLKRCGATVVRLPLNYRHFERDSNPFEYLDTGFARLDRALTWCAQHGIYAILDLHAVQGWQSLFIDAYKAEDEAFIQCISEKSEPKVTGLDGKQAVEVVNAGNKSIREKRPVKL